MQPSLLQMIDSFVRFDLAWPGFDGMISLVLLSASGPTCWSGRFSRTEKRCGFVDALPLQSNAVVVIGEEEAQQILKTGRLPESPKRLALAGDRSLLRRFIDRYFAIKSSWVRVQQ